MTAEYSFTDLLQNAIADFTPRQSQTQMADRIKAAINDKQILAIEAGTGTGKTFAYLVPALASGKKTVISTGSKNLQDQLFKKDIPTIKKIFSYKGKIALLKGRSNYLCIERLNDNYLAAGELESKLKADLNKVKFWSLSTVNGDINLCASVKESSYVWPLVTSTNENCLGSDCPSFNDCYVFKARKVALDADVVIVNHHLYLADMALKDGGFGELIPKSDIHIFDEAHQLPDLACHYFSEKLSTKQLILLGKDMLTCYYTELKDVSQLKKCVDNIEKCCADLHLSVNKINHKGEIKALFFNTDTQDSLQFLMTTIEFCHDVIKESLGRSKLLDNCFNRIVDALKLLKKIFDKEKPGFSFWYELLGKNVSLSITPLYVADKFKALINNDAATWVFTSATLSVDNKLNFFTQRLGLEHANTLILNSPFDYQNQSIFCVPRYLPNSKDKNQATELAHLLLPTIEANKGRCFLLCTSHHMMNELAGAFKTLTNLPVLVQGETSKSELLETFIAKGNVLLIATGSFWEGVDVKGDALSCVIIDKLPFASPDEPLVKARIADCKQQGLDPFYEIQLPEAIITLKQGIGRLIRHNNDKGAVIICDNRLVNKHYGKLFLSSLPPLQKTRDLQKVNQFLITSKELNDE